MRSREQRMSQEQERRGARQHGGQVVPASGAIPALKGDVRTPSTLIEYKITKNKSISIKDDWLEKIAAEALVEGRTAVLGIEMASGRPWVMVEESEWLEREEFYQRGRSRGDR